MSTRHYVRRPHRAVHQAYEYVQASDTTPWCHVGYVLLLVAVLMVAVMVLGGRFILGGMR